MINIPVVYLVDDLERKIVNIYQQLTNLECGFRMLRKLRNIFFFKSTDKGVR